MPDIAMCKGDKCPKKEQCYRYTAKPSEYLQTYFTNPPYKLDWSQCDYFWSNGREQNDSGDLL